MGSDWKTLPGWTPSAAVLGETLDGGQSFRWSRSDETWTGLWGESTMELQLGIDPKPEVKWRSLAGKTDDSATALRRYLAFDLDWAALTDALPWRSDAHLAQCIAAFPDLRILRQPFGETLLGFLCSATKQIVQIKQMCALLAERHGSAIGGRAGPFASQPVRGQIPGCEHAATALGPPLGRGRPQERTTQPSHQIFKEVGPPAPAFHRLPSWPELAQIPEKDLRNCLLGFRARYIAATAQFLAARPGWLEETEHQPYPVAKARLMELPGVGEKVADCVLLFGAGKLEAFPVDTWVLKSLARRYGLDDWKPAQVAHFGRTHFGPLAGLAQQYLFAWERKYGGR